MVRSRRSISKEDVASLLTDSGISLSSPPAVNHQAYDADETDEQKPGINVSRATKRGAHHDDHDEDDDDDDKDDDDDDDEGDDDAEYGTADGDDDDADYKLPAKKKKHQQRNKKPRIKLEAASTTTQRRKATSSAASAHVCTVCTKEFGGKTDLKRHMLIHSDERPHKCAQCGKCYRQAVNLKNHITTAHEGRKEYTCKLCPKSFALKERLRLHMRLHSGEKPYACALCDKRFARGGQLQQHVVSHHKTSIQQFNCTKCSASFSTNANLRVHMTRHEQGPEHRCAICEAHFPNEMAVRAHINQIHYKLKQFDCEVCHKTIEDDDLATHMSKHAPVKMHICQICNSYFTQKSQYNVHMRMHTGERPYQCRICYQTFAHSSVLKLHIRKHTGEKPFKCLLCADEVAFSQLAHLKTHMKKIHKQQNPYMCEGCNEFFKVKVELQAHEKLCAKRQNANIAAEELAVDDSQAMSKIRFHMAVVLKKISSEHKLRQLGYEKRLIDNVVIASLKLANRPAHDDPKLSAIDRLRLNVQEFLNWIVPAAAMDKFREELLSTDTMLDKIATMYMKQK